MRLRRGDRDVLRDPEVLELLRDEPELLAIADAVHARLGGEHRRRRRRRRLGAALATVGAAVLTGAVLVLLRPWLGGPSFVEQALAAIPGQGPVVHVVVDAAVPGREVVELATGRARADTVELESWFDEQRGLLHTIVRSRGTVVADILASPRETVSAAGPVLGSASGTSVARTLLGFATGYRQALVTGEAGAYAGERLGRPEARWVVVATPFGRELVALDATTLRPLEARPLPPSRTSPQPIARVLATSSMSRAEANFRRPQPAAPGAAAGAVAAAREVSVPEAARALARPALWAGPSLGGLPLRVIQRQSLVRFFPAGAPQRRTFGTGLSLVYGAAARGRPDWRRDFLQIQQATSPEPAYGFLLGTLRLVSPASSGDVLIERRPLTGGRAGAIWVGQLASGGLYLTLTASRRALVVDAARRLAPLRVAG